MGSVELRSIVAERNSKILAQSDNRKRFKSIWLSAHNVPNSQLTLILTFIEHITKVLEMQNAHISIRKPQLTELILKMAKSNAGFWLLPMLTTESEIAQNWESCEVASFHIWRYFRPRNL